jgi:3-deoxy-7-phosphoheptulonate synthase
MIVVMERGCKQEHVDHVVQIVREMGLQEHVIQGTERTVVAVIGDERFKDRGVLEQAPMVEQVIPILAPYKMASREMKAESSAVPISVTAAVGGTRIAVIAGPCSVESRQQVVDLAHQLKESGAVGLRGGAFKPRTSPYQFQGMGQTALEYLAEARERTGLAVVTEVMSIDQVDLIARYADVLQIGTRNMHNFNLLEAVGQTHKPVLLKRGWSSTLDEFLLAAEYIIKEGNQNVILCERGIRTHETYVRNTLALGIVPAIKRHSHLPIIIDPSHATGHSYMVPAMAKAAIAAGADGLLIEVHPDPEHALTDGAQSITPKVFDQMMRDLARVAAAVDRTM